MAIHFTKEEFAERKSKVIKELKKQNLDALLMFRQESMYWLTGYDTFGYVYFQCLVLTVRGELVLLTRTPDLRQAQNTSIIKDIRIWVDKDRANPTSDLKNILSELSLEKSNLGIEYEAYGLTGRNAISLNNSLEKFSVLHDKSELVSCLRVIKSSAEIVYVKKAAALADKAMEAAWKYAHAKQNEAKILSEMQSIIFQGGGDYPANEFIIGSGKNALLCRYQSEKRKLDEIDQLSIEWAGTYKHYHSAMFRTIPIGKVNDKQKKMYSACLEALKACENKLKRGNKIGEVFEPRKATAVATSLALATRPSGIFLIVSLLNFLFLKNFLIIGVSTNVGQTVFTRILFFAKSIAIPFVKPSRPNFVILYTLLFGPPT